MKYLAIVSLFSMSLMGASAEVTQYMNELESAVKAENRSFNRFDAVRGKEIFTSTHTGKSGKPMACISCIRSISPIPAKTPSPEKSSIPSPHMQTRSGSPAPKRSKDVTHCFSIVFARGK